MKRTLALLAVAAVTAVVVSEATRVALLTTYLRAAAPARDDRARAV